MVIPMSTQKENHKSSNKRKKIDRNDLFNIYDAIREIRYGSVQIHIQDGKIVQIDKLNKVRIR